MPDPWAPVSRATRLPSSPVNLTRKKWRNGAPSVIGSATTTGVTLLNTAACPSILRMAGRTNSSNVTIALTGLPGRPIHGRPSRSPIKPKPTGAPGRMRIRQNLFSRCSSSRT